MDESFEAFVAARGRRLFATAYLITQDRALAEDLVQTALLRTWKHWSRVQSPEGYLHRAMVNTYTSWWRRKWNSELPLDELPEIHVAGADDQLDERADLRAALARLPRRQRAVLVLRFYEDLSVSEVANLLGCAEGTVKSQTSKALARLGADETLARQDQGSPPAAEVRP